MAGIDLGGRRSTPDDLWIPLSREEVRTWRKQLPRGWRRETTTEHRRIAEQARTHDGEQAELTVQKPVKPREGRETVAIVARDILEWARANPDLMMERVRFLKQQGQMEHLTDDEAVAQLSALAEKLARSSAERVYSIQGYNTPVRLE